MSESNASSEEGKTGEAPKGSGDQQIPGYQLLERIGSGAYGLVYKARQISLDRRVAIKVLPTRRSTDEEFVQRFYAEGRAAAQLNHANIVQPIDVGKAGQYHYFVMEYIDGETVADKLEEEARLPQEEAIRIILDIARALDHAHKAGLIHRDVKPQNIMITGDGVAKLADMGLASSVNEHEFAESERGKAVGTPFYISPEQIRGKGEVEARSDLYSLGATFYHMVTGSVPFEAPSAKGVMRKHLTGLLTAPDELSAGLSQDTSHVIQVCLARHIESRYDSAADLVQDMEALQMGEAPLQAQLKLGVPQGAEQDTDEEEEAKPETAASASDAEGPRTSYQRTPRRLRDEPLFWLAAAGWPLALILFLLLLMT